MKLDEFQEKIKAAYKDRGRDVIEASGHLQCEASELAELLLKEKWYGKRFDKQDLKSEAGDILNFLTFILQSYNLTLTDAMHDNIEKLTKRGWI